MSSYLDKAGLSYFWSKLKSRFDGKADASHVHDAGDITSGTFGASRIPNLAASKITSGTFGVSRGGTGKSSVTAGNYLIGNGTSAMTEKTPAEVLAHIGAAASSHGHDAATSSAAGFMSATDKAKLDGIASGANAYSHPASHPASMITGLADVATSGSYNDLSDKPTIPSYSAAGSSLGLVKSGGDVTISDGVITVKDDSHAHTIANVDGLQSALNGKETSGAAATALTNAKAYTDEKISGLINSAPTTLDTLGEIATAMEENAEVVEALESAIGNKANAADLTSHVNNKSNPHGVTLGQLGVTATAAELNILDGVTATAAELNFVDGVTSSIQTQLNGKAASSHNHSASNITSGTLAVARGGTGVTSNPSMLVNLGSTSAASVFAASPRPGVTGALPIANGGTGATTADAALANLGVTSITDTEIDELMV